MLSWAMDTILLAVALGTVAAALFWAFFSAFLRPRGKPWSAERATRGAPARERPAREGSGGLSARSCPVCKEALAPGWRVKSRVWKQQGQEKLMHIFGCGYCYPPNTEHERFCPVCGNLVPREGYLIARFFDTPARKHVHVLGCSGCRRG